MNSSLNLLVEKGTFDEVKKALEEGADPNKVFGRTPPLHIAAKKRRLDFIELLIKHGANVNGVDRRGCTALHFVFEEKSTCVAVCARRPDSPAPLQDKSCRMH